MKSNKLSAFAIFSMATISVLTSCQDEDFGFTPNEVRTSKYAKNFFNEYGKFDPSMSWDLSKTMPRTSKYDPIMLGGAANTRAVTGTLTVTRPQTENEWYNVEKTTINWLNQYLVEKQNNTNLGTPFSLSFPTNKFAIIPIYQGEAGMDWSLYISVDGVDTKLWQESQGIKMSDDGKKWTQPGTEYGNSQTIGKDYIKSEPIFVEYSGGNNSEFSLYLYIDKGQGGYANTGTKQSSKQGMMLALSCPTPTNIGTDNQAMIIGCEDADLGSSDWDMNDVCFLIIGYPNIPDRISYNMKRYMCEDLGNTYDFDFNDIVVDVTEVVHEVYDASSNSFVPSTTIPKKQYATVKHVCGTLPFQVTVGNYTFPAVSDPTDENKTKSELTSDSNPAVTRAVNWNPDITKEITGWNPETNNVSIKVADSNNSYSVLTSSFGSDPVTEDASKHIYNITFPAAGEAPLIIATNQTTQWMDEHVHIPSSWWKDGNFKPTENTNQETQQGGNQGGNEVVNNDHEITLDTEYSYELSNWSNKVAVPASELQNIKVGDIIKVSFDYPDDDNDNRNAVVKNNSLSADISSLTKAWDTDNSNKYITVTVTDDNIATIKNGICVIGTNITFVKLTIEESVDPKEPENNNQNTDQIEIGSDEIDMNINSFTVSNNNSKGLGDTVVDNIVKALNENKTTMTIYGTFTNNTITVVSSWNNKLASVEAKSNMTKVELDLSEALSKLSPNGEKLSGIGIVNNGSFTITKITMK